MYFAPLWAFPRKIRRRQRLRLAEQLDPKSIKTGLFYFDWITDTFSAYPFDSISVRAEERDDEGSKRTRGALEMHYTITRP